MYDLHFLASVLDKDLESTNVSSLYTITPTQDIDCPAYKATIYPNNLTAFPVIYMDFKPKQLQPLRVWQPINTSVFQTLYSRYTC
ncbi:unnamed protein product [Gongylonema pulchrum]|uniref:Uncharacterized protein n=1 Tax=Gongylonema pulchrum TaxID=637853 RepID=A0A3P6RYD2_9BILA|nr:unnamed protein product [Gongylonema pulchrum]